MKRIKIRGYRDPFPATEEDVENYYIAQAERGKGAKNVMAHFSFMKYVKVEDLGPIEIEHEVSLDLEKEQARKRYQDAEERWQQMALSPAGERTRYALYALAVLFPQYKLYKKSTDKAVTKVQKLVLSWMKKNEYRTVVDLSLIRKIASILGVEQDENGAPLLNASEIGAQLYGRVLANDITMSNKYYGTHYQAGDIQPRQGQLDTGERGRPHQG